MKPPDGSGLFGARACRQPTVPPGSLIGEPGHWACENQLPAYCAGDSMKAGMTTWCPDPNALRGGIAVVAGATRGAGRGIAAALGEAGATVICSGRSSRSRSLQSDYDRPETIEETAELVTALGGNGIPVVVDHLD